MKHLNKEHKKQFTEVYRLNLEKPDKEHSDTINASNRGTEYRKVSGYIDWLMTALLFRWLS